MSFQTVAGAPSIKGSGASIRWAARLTASTTKSTFAANAVKKLSICWRNAVYAVKLAARVIVKKTKLTNSATIPAGEVNEVTMYWMDLMTPFGLVLIGLATMFFWPEKK
jgi:hypothetical protein